MKILAPSQSPLKLFHVADGSAFKFPAAVLLRISGMVVALCMRDDFGVNPVPHVYQYREMQLVVISGLEQLCPYAKARRSSWYICGNESARKSRHGLV